MRRPALLGFALFFVLFSGPTSRAHAQERPSVDTRTWRPSTDFNGTMVIEPAVTPGPGIFSVGAFGSYALRPIALRKAGTDDVAYRPVETAFDLDATANVGIGQRFALGLDVPMALYQDGSAGLPPTVAEVDHVPSSSIGDIDVRMKGAILRNNNGGPGLALLGNVSLPTGDRASFMGDGSVTVSARALAEYTVLVAVLQASLGYKYRTDHHTWPAQEVGGYRFGDEIPWSLGLAFKPGLLGVDPGNRQRWEIGAHGWLPAGPVGPFGLGDPGSSALSPALLAASDRIELGHYRDAFLLAGFEVGLNQAVGVPILRAVVGLGWSPHGHDMDGDGVKDDVDGCPEIPEDKDGFEDADGCPEIDNDDDGIVDKEDACPNVKGDPSPDPRRNGCPMNDADGDGIPDDEDACPKEKGERSLDPKKNGCPGKDADGDGIPDGADKCPTQPEDKDGFQDADGCPDPDNDGDGIPDKEDACPNVKGEPSTDPKLNGCPNPDRDGDTYGNDVDKCPDSAETFNGVDDDDGCPDEGGKPLVVIDENHAVKLATPITLAGAGSDAAVDPASLVTVRALALELNRRPDWTLAIGVRPAGADPTKAQLDSLAAAFAVVRELSTLTHRDGAAETIGWDAVKGRPGAAQAGMGFLVLAAMPIKPATPAPAPKAKGP